MVIAESIVASSAATLSVTALDVPVWAMFVGWISFFTRGMNLRQRAINLGCVLIGVGLGIGAALAMAALTPLLGQYTLTAVVFAITGIALSLAKAPALNNLLGFFLGLVAYFASHQPPSVAAFTMLASAATLGTMAAFIAHSLQRRIQRRGVSRRIECDLGPCGAPCACQFRFQRWLPARRSGRMVGTIRDRLFESRPIRTVLPSRTSRLHMLSTASALLLFALTMLGLWLVSWSRRAGARHARAKAEEEARILTALVDVSRYAGQPVDRLKEVLGDRCRYSSFDFGAFTLEWDIGQVQIIAWCRGSECESMEILPRSN